MFRFTTALGILALVLTASAASAQSLRGSRASLARQNRIADGNEFTFLRTVTQVNDFVARGVLIRLPGNDDYEVERASFPYARPEVKGFVERLARQYRIVCGEKLVVTSLTRPILRQPRNASDRSVHPTGMAIDFRRTNRLWCRHWLEETLLALEKKEVLEATRESRPPHYHVALYPKSYTEYVEAGGATGNIRTAALQGTSPYHVKPGDSLWTIARTHGTTIDRIKQINGLRTSRIYAGQLLRIPETK